MQLDRNQQQPGYNQQQQWGQPPPYGQEPYRSPGVTSLPSNAQLVFIITALSFMAGAIIAPVGWYLASQELRRIDAGEADPSQRGAVQTCKLINLVMTILLIMAFVSFALLMVVSVALPLIFAGASAASTM